METLQKLPAPLQERLMPLFMKMGQDPYSLALMSIPVSFAFGYIPHFVKATLMTINKGADYNNETPRTEDVSTYPKFSQCMVRCAGAHQNSMEMFPFFAASILIGRLQKVNPMELTALTAKYLVLRLVYLALYIGGVNKGLAALRTASWVMMMQLVFKIANLGL